MPDSWMPPSGPPNGVPLHPADAKREIEEATVAARTHDQALRSQIAALSASRVVAEARLVAGATEVDEVDFAVGTRKVGRCGCKRGDYVAVKRAQVAALGKVAPAPRQQIVMPALEVDEAHGGDLAPLGGAQTVKCGEYLDVRGA